MPCGNMQQTYEYKVYFSSGEMYEEHGNKLSKITCFYVLLFCILFFYVPKPGKLKSIIKLPHPKNIELDLMEANFQKENCNLGFAIASLRQYEQFRRTVINSSLSN